MNNQNDSGDDDDDSLGSGALSIEPEDEDDDEIAAIIADPSVTLARRRRRRRSDVCYFVLSICVSLVVAVACTVYYQSDWPVHTKFENLSHKVKSTDNTQQQQQHQAVSSTVNGVGLIPKSLWNLKYNESDFVNPDGVVPPYWTCVNGSCNSSRVWGPCYSPNEPILDWQDKATLYFNGSSAQLYSRKSQGEGSRDVSGLCRPGFLIIGQGKCGTSSLYHYITEHPRVLPAKEKQIHYFKYYLKNGIRWYYQHFPTTVAFLSSGALMTGEASPGYMPYPDVAAAIQQRMPGPKIIALGRNPIERAYSSYKYNYVQPLLEQMKKGKVSNVEKGKPDEYYEKRIFSFEDMVGAELGVLRECLALNGTAITGAEKSWGKMEWAQSEFQRRSKSGLSPLADLDYSCYGGQVSGTVLRKQWATLVSKNPNKYILDKNLHLVQSMLGRSLYVLPLEWWYAIFKREDLLFVCTEELSDMSGASLSKVASFLGLPPFNFSSTLQLGAYNVGGHRGYDTEISWDKIHNESSQDESKRTVPLSDEFMQELSDFYAPYNERLFELVGKRCDW